MLIKGVMPDGWVKREWGSMKDFPAAMSKTLVCADDKGNNPPWWGGTMCESYTDKECHKGPVKGGCDGGATCLSNRCVCGLGTNGISMCAQECGCVDERTLVNISVNLATAFLLTIRKRLGKR